MTGFMPLQPEDIERLHLELLIVASTVAFATPWVSPWSVLLGGAVMGSDFWLMRQAFQRLVRPARPRRPGVVFGLVLVKFSLLMVLLGALFWRVPIDALGFGVGAAVLPVACVAAAVRHQRTSAEGV